MLSVEVFGLIRKLLRSSASFRGSLRQQSAPDRTTHLLIDSPLNMFLVDNLD